MINKENFYINTCGTFVPCDIPQREPDFYSDGGSSYWYGEDEKGEYVIRSSDHWGHFASVCWLILEPNQRDRFNNIATGKIYLSDLNPFCYRLDAEKQDLSPLVGKIFKFNEFGKLFYCSIERRDDEIFPFYIASHPNHHTDSFNVVVKNPF